MTERFIDSSCAAPPGPGQGPDSTAVLAASLLQFEAQFEAQRPEAVVLTDASEAALAAALVAAKLLIPLRATADATASPDANAELIAQLADAYTPST